MMKPFCVQLKCHDGATVSVQASEFHYCTPRNDDGPYTHVEAGFPSVTPPASWAEYGDSLEPTLTADVYGYLPVALIHEFIDAHGGLVSGTMPNGCCR